MSAQTYSFLIVQKNDNYHLNHNFLTKLCTALIITLLADPCQGCVQVSFLALKNAGTITDYMSSEDEISAAITIGKDFAIYIGNPNLKFGKHGVMEFIEGSISFPCFSGENMYLRVKEHDEFKDDQETIAVSCDNLDLGKTTIEIQVGEDSGGIQSIANIWNDWFGTKIQFHNDEQEATYQFDFDVTEKCVGLWYESQHDVFHSDPDINAINLKVSQQEEQDRMDEEQLAWQKSQEYFNKDQFDDSGLLTGQARNETVMENQIVAYVPDDYDMEKMLVNATSIMRTTALQENVPIVEHHKEELPQHSYILIGLTGALIMAVIFFITFKLVQRKKQLAGNQGNQSEQIVVSSNNMELMNSQSWKGDIDDLPEIDRRASDIKLLSKKNQVNSNQQKQNIEQLADSDQDDDLEMRAKFQQNYALVKAVKRQQTIAAQQRAMEECKSEDDPENMQESKNNMQANWDNLDDYKEEAQKQSNSDMKYEMKKTPYQNDSMQVEILPELQLTSGQNNLTRNVNIHETPYKNDDQIVDAIPQAKPLQINSQTPNQQEELKQECKDATPFKNDNQQVEVLPDANPQQQTQTPQGNKNKVRIVEQIIQQQPETLSNIADMEYKVISNLDVTPIQQDIQNQSKQWHEMKVVPIDAQQKTDTVDDQNNNPRNKYALPDDEDGVSERSVNDLELQQPSFESSVEIVQRDGNYTTFDSSVDIVLNSQGDQEGDQDQQEEQKYAAVEEQAELVFTKVDPGQAYENQHRSLKTFVSNDSSSTHQDTFKSWKTQSNFIRSQNPYSSMNSGTISNMTSQIDILESKSNRSQSIQK